jgi:hypothetical protein
MSLSFFCNLDLVITLASSIIGAFIFVNPHATQTVKPNSQRLGRCNPSHQRPSGNGTLCYSPPLRRKVSSLQSEPGVAATHNANTHGESRSAPSQQTRILEDLSGRANQAVSTLRHDRRYAVVDPLVHSTNQTATHRCKLWSSFPNFPFTHSVYTYSYTYYTSNHNTNFPLYPFYSSSIANIHTRY